MLVLSRSENDSIVIGDDIKIKVISISGKRVRIGIDAPQKVSIAREEIYTEHKTVRSSSIESHYSDELRRIDREFRYKQERLDKLRSQRHNRGQFKNRVEQIQSIDMHYGESQYVAKGAAKKILERLLSEVSDITPMKFSVIGS